MDELDETLEELRPRAFAIAYRMLGSVADAEDIAQEGLIRLHQTLADGERIDSPLAYLTTIVTRLAIDELRSARARRERYVGEWLPEPLLTDEGAGDPADEAELSDTLSFAFLVVLERLSPEQRAVFLLREVFDYPYERIAAIVDKREPAVRQIATRARRRVAADRPRFEVPAKEHEELTRRFFAAARDGEVEALESLLAEDAVLHGDGGGRVPALARPVTGGRRIARTLAAWGRAAARVGGAEVRISAVNGQPGAITLTPDGELINVFVLEVAAGRIQEVNSIVNPDKLQHLGPVADMMAVLGRK